MTGLLCLPDELLTQIYILASLNTRSLVRLSATNRRLRTIWLQDSDYIISRSLELKAPGHQDAITLTNMEARCPMPVSGFHHLDSSQEHPLLRLHLPQLKRNVGLCSAICRNTMEWHNSTYKKDPIGHPLPSLFYLLRRLMLAYHYPEFRRPLCDILKSYSDEALEAGRRIKVYLGYRNAQGADFRRALQIYDYNAERIPFDDLDEKPGPPETGAWGFAWDVMWKLEDDREECIEADPDDGYYAFGCSIENREWEQATDIWSVSGPRRTDFLKHMPYWREGF